MNPILLSNPCVLSKFLSFGTFRIFCIFSEVTTNFTPNNLDQSEHHITPKASKTSLLFMRYKLTVRLHVVRKCTAVATSKSLVQTAPLLEKGQQDEGCKGEKTQCDWTCAMPVYSSSITKTTSFFLMKLCVVWSTTLVLLSSRL